MRTMKVGLRLPRRRRLPSRRHHHPRGISRRRRCLLLDCRSSVTPLGHRPLVDLSAFQHGLGLLIFALLQLHWLLQTRVGHLVDHHLANCMSILQAQVALLPYLRP